MEQPERVENILRSLCTVTPSHLLDRDLFDFGGLRQAKDS